MFGGLQLWRIGRQEEKAYSVRNLEIGWAMPSGIVENKDDDAVAGRLRLPANASNKASKNGFETPLEMYQKHSPVAGETKAVT